MKTKLLSHLLFVGMAMYLLSCHREEPETAPVEPSIHITTAEAQQWFTQHLSTQPVISNGRSASSVKREPVWEKALRIKLQNGMLAISVPLHYEKGYGIDFGGITNLVVYRDEQGRMQARILKAIGTKSYFDRNHQIEKENFTGALLLFDWQENFSSGALYADGKAIADLSDEPANARNGRTASACYQVRNDYYVTACGGEYCDTHFDYSTSYYVCTSGGGGSSSGVSAGDAGNAISGGGGGSSGGNNRSEGRSGYVRMVEPLYYLPGQNKPPIDIDAFMNCFGAITADASYQLTVYVQEPVSGSGDTKFMADVGHAFVGLRKTLNGATIEQVVGFYPEEKEFGWIASKISDNGGSHYTVSAFL